MILCNCGVIFILATWDWSYTSQWEHKHRVVMSLNFTQTHWRCWPPMQTHYFHAINNNYLAPTGCQLICCQAEHIYVLLKWFGCVVGNCNYYYFCSLSPTSVLSVCRGIKREKVKCNISNESGGCTPSVWGNWNRLLRIVQVCLV